MSIPSGDSEEQHLTYLKASTVLTNGLTVWEGEGELECWRGKGELHVVRDGGAGDGEGDRLSSFISHLQSL